MHTQPLPHPHPHAPGRGVAQAAIRLALWGWLATAQAATYYVATNGNDSASGTNTTAPWKTISHAASRMMAGDTTFIRGGTYRETVSAGASGSSATSRITYAAYPGEMPVVSGADIYTNWTWDTTGSPSAWKTPWSLSLPSTSNKFATNPVVLRREMIIFDGQVLTPVGSRSQLVNGTFWASGSDTNPLAIFALFPGGASPTGHTVEAATRSRCFTSNGKNYLAVSGLTFSYGCNTAQDLLVEFTGQHHLIQSNIIQWANAGGLYVAGSANTAAYNIVQNNGQLGYSGGGTSNLWDYNQALGNNWKGYSANWEAGGGKWANTYNSTIRHHLAVNNGGPGIWLDITNVNNSIEECLCYSNASWGIKVEIGSYNNTVKNNVIFRTRFNPPYESTAGGGIMLLDATNNYVQYNTIFNCAGSGIYVFTDSRITNSSFQAHNKLYNNLVAFNATGGGSSQGEGYQMELRGRSTADALSQSLNGNLYYRGSSPGSTFYFQGQTGTDSLSTWTSWSHQDTNALAGADPLLADKTVYSGFHLSAASPAKALAVMPPVSTTTDYEGEPRPANGADTGADQFSPAAPTNLSATPSNAVVNLSWTASAGANSYNVKRSTSSGGPYSTIHSGSTTSYVDSGLANGTTYYYVVSATVTSGGESPNSTQVSATPQAPPAPPSGLTPTPSGTQISLTWNTASGATRYNVKRSIASGGPYTTIATTNSTSYVNSGLSTGTTYYYVVSSIGVGGEGANSGQVSATTVPNAPAGLAATGGSQQVSLSWNASAGASNYNVKRSTVNGGPYTTVTNVATTSYLDTGLVAGTTYFYVVTALNAAGESGNSLQASATTTPPPPTSASIPLYQVNAGAGAVSPFIADSFYTNGVQYAVTNTIDLTAVSSPAPMAVYQSYRYVKTNGNTFTYTFTHLQIGEAYTVRLHFADLFNSAPGQRQFHVDINGTRVLTNFDIIATVGAPFKALVEEWSASADASGQIAVKFTATTLDSACVNGIELLSAFTGQDIGAVGVPGSALYSNSTYSVSGSGADIWGTNDAFYFVSRPYTGDVVLITYVASVENTDPSAKAGLMLRQSMDSDSMFVDMFVTPGAGVAFQRRTNTAAAALGGYTVTGVTPPCWLKLVRTGNVFAGYYATNGSGWILDGTDTVNLDAAVNVGLEVCSHNNSSLCTATFTNTTVQLPWSSSDVGAVPVAGDAYQDPETGAITVDGPGADVWGVSDQFHYAYQELDGNGQIVARVLSVENTDPWAKAGVMIRQSLATNSSYVFMMVSPSSGIAFQQRTNASTSAFGGTTITGISAPCWLKVIRTNNVFSGYYSTDGTNWSQDGSNSPFPMVSPAYIGLAVCAHTNGPVLCTGVFTNITVTPTH